MVDVSIKEVRNNLSALLNKVKHGEEIAVTRHGKKVACLVPPDRDDHLPSLREFRKTIQNPGGALSETVVKNREVERY